MPDAGTVARQHYVARTTLSRRAADAAAQWWKLLDAGDLDGSWSGIAGPVLTLVGAGQYLAAQSADDYLDAVLVAQQLDPASSGIVDPAAFAGTASDGRPLDTLLAEPIIAAKVRIGLGASADEAMLSGLASLVRIVSTQVTDAGRTADGVALTARSAATGYVRALSPPSCSRCTILAGRVYHWSAGFKRHPQCDCLHIPTTIAAASGRAVDPMAALRAGHVTGISQADLHAVMFDGADINQVVNAHRGMSTADVYGHTLKVTNEGVSVRGIAGQRLGDAAKTTGQRYRASKTPRLMPEAIYQLAAGDREEAVRLLRRFGYVL